MFGIAIVNFRALFKADGSGTGVALPGIDQPAVETLRARFQSGVFWSVTAALASSGFNFVLNIAIARLLGRETFGQFGIVQSTIATVSGIAQLAMDYVARNRLSHCPCRFDVVSIHFAAGRAEIEIFQNAFDAV